MSPTKLSLALHALLGLAAVVNAVPHRARAPPLIHRDAGNQPVCVPISPVLHDVSDLAAKVRPPDGVCEANEIFRTPTTNNRALLKAADESDDDYSCSKDKPCGNGACCAKSGFCGFGPKYCGKNGESPNDKCWSNCDAHAECGKYAEKEGQECPLNVCCSQYGFCGMTAEFCDKGDDDGDGGDDGDDDEPTGCQSNCEQPTSGSSGSEVRERVIGYYEVWNHDKKCINMGIDDVPVESLTHLYYAFGYIDPETFFIVPMDDGDDGDSVSEYTFSAVAGLKKKNPDLKVILAVGGWTFNDNHTVWQSVFHNMVSTQENRDSFIFELGMFNYIYGFDGIDFDWEYPGATDRGGHKEDGENFTKLLEELADAASAVNENLGGDFEISFTAPTSYWYLRHFDLKASAAAVNYVNLMSYDLHGIWDSDNPIGSHVLAHTNLTEIDLALDLLWRNDVAPAKVNLGLGFYGRSFQLADPACNKPGCLFKGGGEKGSCTDQSGILSYNEIMEIKEKYNLNPVHDEENAVKWITWNENQWVSYDDQETFQAKIKFANDRGLGGVMIWAVDLDTPQLDALAGVIYPKQIGFRGDRSKGEDNWEGLTEGVCYTSDCASNNKPSCKTGYIKLQTIDCGDDDWPTNNPDGKSAVCCPVASSPDNDECTWRGNGDFCNGQCHDDEVAIVSSKWGGGDAYCKDGRKFLCCETQVQKPDCHWNDCGDPCGDDENEMTWRSANCLFDPMYGGGLMRRDEPDDDYKQKFCCSKDQEWQNCAWHGKPGSCYDNHCDTGEQIALTVSAEGEGDDCGAMIRSRTFCCDLPDNIHPFLPVPLEYLFPNAPDEEDVAVDFDLKVDPTWGGAEAEENVMKDEEPDEAPFGFIVMTSPPEVQQTLDKRDGSHWEVFDCRDSKTVGTHTVKMTCTDQSEDSNCGNIHLGHGAAGTIIQMPNGCGPGKYAVLKDLAPSLNQTMPGHLAKRGLADTVYDLTFDYDFKRVPRDLGDTNMRIDYSNDVDYWDNVVDKAADTKKKRKRGLHEVGGNHKRWLEEEYREDAHFGAVDPEEFHKRWFGSGIIDWLKKFVGTVEKTVEFGHHFSEDYILKIVDQQVSCPNLDAYLDVHAETHVEAAVSYGFTVIAKLGSPIDLSDSYLFFRTKGEVSAAFVVDAAVTYHFDTGDVKLFSADRFGAAFAIPGIVTIGPNFEVHGQIEGQATLGVNFESRVKLANWEIEQTYPVPDNDDDYLPQSEKDVDKDGFSTPQKPEVTWSVGINGHVAAHVKPSIVFGIMWDDLFFDIDDCAVRLTADGHVRFHASASTGSSGSEICYGIDAGADLYATIDAPSAIDWALPDTPYYLVKPDDIDLFSTCYTPSKRSFPSIDGDDEQTAPLQRRNVLEIGDDGMAHGKHLGKRAQVWGPLIPSLPLGCPGGEKPDEERCPACLYGDYEDRVASPLTKRDSEVCDYDPNPSDEETCPVGENGMKREWGLDERSLVKRGTKKPIIWNWSGGREEIIVLEYPSCGVAVRGNKVEKWYGYHPTQCSPRVILLTQAQVNAGDDEYVTEHIYEAQTIKMFLEFLINGPLPKDYTKASRDWVSEVIIGLGSGSRTYKNSAWGGNTLWQQLFSNLGSDSKLDGLVVAEDHMNGKKEKMFGGSSLNSKNADAGNQKEKEQLTKNRHRNTAGVFWYMKTTKIWAIFVEASQGIDKALGEFDAGYSWGETDQLGRPQGRTTAGLQELYRYWIDKYLAGHEASISTWRSAAKTNYVKEFGQTNWADHFDKGDMTTSALKYPRGTGNHGSGGTWTASNYKDLWTGSVGPFS